MVDVAVEYVLAGITVAGAIVAVFVWLWRVSGTVADNRSQMASLVKEVATLAALKDRVLVLETRFIPLLAILDEHIEKLFPKNPVDPKLVAKVRAGTATLEELAEADMELKEEISVAMAHRPSADPLDLILSRYWVAVQRADLEQRLKDVG